MIIQWVIGSLVGLLFVIGPLLMLGQALFQTDNFALLDQKHTFVRVGSAVSITNVFFFYALYCVVFDRSNPGVLVWFAFAAGCVNWLLLRGLIQEAKALEKDRD